MSIVRTLKTTFVIVFGVFSLGVLARTLWSIFLFWWEFGWRLL